MTRALAYLAFFSLGALAFGLVTALTVVAFSVRWPL